MDPDEAIYIYESLYESFLNQQPSYPPQSNSGGETFIVAGEGTSQNAGGNFGNSWDGHNFSQHFSQTIIGGSSAAVTSQHQVFVYSDTPETPSETSLYSPPTGPIAYPSISIPSFLNPIPSQVIQPSCSISIADGVQRYHCVCGHET